MTAPSRRTIVRRVLITLAALLTVLLALRSVYGWRAGRRLAAAATVAEQSWKRLAAPSGLASRPADADNRARAIEAAAVLQALDPKDVLLLNRLSRFEESGFPALNRAALAAVVDRNRLVFELLDHAQERPEADWGVYFLRGEAHFPNLIELLRLGRLVTAKALLAADRGDMAEGLAALEQGYSVSGSLAQERFVILQMVRAAIDRMSHGALRALLAAGEPDAASLERMSRLVAQSTDREDFTSGLIADLARVDSLIVALENGTLPESAARTQCLGRPAAWLLRPLIMEDHRRALSTMDEAVRSLRQAPYQRAAAAESRVDRHAFLRRWLGPFDLSSKTVLPRADMAEARRLLAQTAVALRRYRLDHGTYPETLAELAPAYVPAPPIDPFTGRAPEYRRQGAGFVLRSAGDDDARAASSGPGDKVLRWEIPR